MRRFDSIAEYEAWRTGEEVEAVRARFVEERRAFRRKHRLDLKWAGFFYACTVYCGTITATFDQWGISIFGLAFAAVGAAFLDAGLRDLFGEGK